MKDFYYILGTDENCSFDELKDAYRKLAKKFHPDVNQNDKYFENHFREIQEAFEYLSDPVKRARYNAEIKKLRSASSKQQFVKQSSKTTTFIDITFTLILIVVTIIFGDYVLRSINTEGKSPAKITAATAPSVNIAHEHRGRKYRLKLKAASRLVKPGSTHSGITSLAGLPGTAEHINPHMALAALAAKPAAEVSNVHQLQTADVSGVLAHAAPDSSKTQTRNYLYATSVRSNLTGVVNMRMMDNYTSSIIAVIPTHSPVWVIEKGSSYYKIRFNSTTGYVPKWALETK